MASIYHWVELLGGLWLFMLLLIFAFGGNRHTKDDKSSQLLMIATLAIVLPVVQDTADGKMTQGGFSWGFPVINYMGFALIFLGVVLHWMGIFTLKKQWSTVVTVLDQHKLVDTGIYRFIRHPIYAALLLELAGFGLALSNWVSLLILLIPNMASLAYRIAVEEKLLEKHFGAEYLEYERRTKRLIPGLF